MYLNTHYIMPARKLIGDIFAYCRVFVMSYVLNICEGRVLLSDDRVCE